MKGVLLVNMGGPGSPKELKSFLARMFMDPAILPYNKLVRTLLSFVISTARYKKSWKKYQLIGGTPLVTATMTTAGALQSILGNDYCVKYAFSYSDPGISDALATFKALGIEDICLIPLYPQSSLTTTNSVKADVRKAAGSDPLFRITFQEEFYQHPGFIAFWVHQIQKHLKVHGIMHPTLVFSAHSIPEYNVLQGDTYPEAIVKSAALIADQLGCHYEVAYQSGMKRGTWIGPDLKDLLKAMAEEQVDNLVLVPISFVHENLETRYDLDHELVPYAREMLGFKNVTRVQLPEADPLLVSLLADLVYQK